MSFPKLHLNGTAGEIGLLYGRQAREMIEANVGYYRRLLGWSDAELALALRPFSAALNHHTLPISFHDYTQGLSESTGITLDEAALLQCRSELFNQHAISECTVLVDQRRGEIGQTWDWSAHAIRNSVVLEVQLGSRSWLSFVEAGQLAKIAINDTGLAVALSILRVNAPLAGVPVHWLIPQLLTTNSTEEATSLLNKMGVGRASHIAMLDRNGHAGAFEFGPFKNYALPMSAHYAHTNHYLTPDLDFAVDAFTSSRPRQAVVESEFVRVPSARIANVLHSSRYSDGQLYRDFEASGVDGFGDVGTVASVLMHPASRAMMIRTSRDASEEKYCLINL